ncbi:MAG: thiamine pyrophosphate-dependent enzyme, partial [Bacteroidetes bacterium]|nr:thiamine pyrophosphate-dependent enzyme [Bacteroidota bacterium]
MTVTKTISKADLKIAEILNDYRIINESREASLLGRKEVFMGKAKFGIFGDGKEVAQVAMAKVFRNGDFRSGYYRDQTFMFSIGELTVQQYFAQLYAHTDVKAEPASAGRLMNGHFATRLLDDNGLWLPQTSRKNSSSDVSCTAAQMPRLVGLAYASKLYRQNPELKDYVDFSINGNEIAFGTIGNASTSEGIFLESINAAGVLQIPMIICIWDDDYGISVPQKYHTTKQDISKALEGFRRNKDGPGYEIFVVKGWDYDALYKTFKKAEKIARNEHVPVMIHVKEMTQPQGHSTSGSHERYKSTRRLEWEKEFDCISKMREWILDQDLVAAEQLDLIEIEAKQSAKDAKNKAWKEFIADIKSEQREACLIMERLSQQSVNGQLIGNLKVGLEKTLAPIRMDTVGTVKKALRLVRKEKVEAKTELQQWLEKTMELNYDRYSSYLYSQSPESALNISEIKPVYSEQSKLVDGREILQANFDAALTNDPRVVAFGEDVGKIGDVNQAFAGLQKKHGELRVMDTGIRESAIIGEGIGLAMRGLKPIAEIQYLDYLIYAIQTLS